MDADAVIDRVSDWLSAYDGHDILDWKGEVLPGLAKYGIKNLGVRLVFGATSARTAARPASLMREEGAHDPKGPQLNPAVPDDLLLIGAF